MAIRVYDQYQEAEILNADPLKLVRLMYRAAIDSIAAARRHVQAGQIPERSRRILRAAAIINELTQSLDRGRGGEIATNLAELYDYVGRKLVQANIQQLEAPLIESEELLRTLLEAWEQQTPAQIPARIPEYAPVNYSY
jgi:flagellar protein FliS